MEIRWELHCKVAGHTCTNLNIPITEEVVELEKLVKVG